MALQTLKICDPEFKFTTEPCSIPLTDCYFGNTITYTMPRYSDLVGQLYITFNTPTKGKLKFPFAEAYIRSISYEINGMRAEELTGEFIHIYNQLNNKKSFENMVAIPFTFCRDFQNAMPMYMLQYSQVTIAITFAKASDVFMDNMDDYRLGNVHLIYESIFIDLKQLPKSHTKHINQIYEQEYIILADKFGTYPKFLQCQKMLTNIMPKVLVSIVGEYCNTINDVVETMTLHCRGLISEMHYVVSDCDLDENIIYNCNPIENTELSINNMTRFNCNKIYNTCIQHSQHHLNVCPNINSYSFSVNPSHIKPSGFLNFSRIDHSTISFHIKKYPTKECYKIRMYTSRSNAIIMGSEMAGIKYSS